jgi:ketosteroid isomerase-like protein
MTHGDHLGLLTLTLAGDARHGNDMLWEQIMNRTEQANPANPERILEIFAAIERRDQQRLFDLCHSDVEFHWPPTLPYGGTSRGFKSGPPTWGHTWIPLQPTEAEQSMDPRVVAAHGDEVVVLWRRRGVSPGGDRVDSPVLGLYEIRDGKLARAQMFYFDSSAVADFLARAKGRAA